MPEMDVPLPITTKVLGYERGVMGPKKSIFTERWTDLHRYQRLWALYMFELG